MIAIFSPHPPFSHPCCSAILASKGASFNFSKISFVSFFAMSGDFFRFFQFCFKQLFTPSCKTGLTNPPAIFRNSSIFFSKFMTKLASRISVSQIFSTSFFWIINSFATFWVFFLIHPSGKHFAQAAYPLPFFIFVRIFFVKFMTSNTMSFSTINSGSSNPSKDIFLASYRFKMIWVNTKFVPAKMIEMLTLWNRPLYHFIRNPVGNIILTICSKTTIPINDSRSPKPTTFGLVNFFPKSFSDCFRCTHAESLLFSVSAVKGVE